MPLLDAKTLLWSNALLTVMISFTLWATIRLRARRWENVWIVSLLLLGGSQAMLAMRGTLPDVVGIGAANILIAAAQGTAYIAIARVMRMEPVLSLSWLPVVAVAGFTVLFWNDMASRIASSNSVYMLQQVLLAWTTFKAGVPYGQRARKVMAAGYLIEASMFGVRVAGALHDPEQFTQVLVSGNAQVATYVVALFGIVLTSMSLLVLHRDEMDHQNRTLATLDPLTGLLNRRALLDHAERSLQVALRAGLPVALLMLDLDHFKRVNDTLGHLAGDTVLRETSRVLERLLRQQDVLGRYGGEEFCLLLPNTSTEGAMVLAERLRASVGGNLVHVRDGSVSVTISIGVAAAEPAAEGLTLECLISRADRALYKAKEAGRDRCMAEPAWVQSSAR